jgi:hypothetical protein
MNKLNLSIGILAWNSGQTLINTLNTYFQSGFIHQVNDVCILFQEFSEQDKQIADHFGIPYIAHKTNIGIGQAFIELTEQAKTENILILEHDWKLIEPLDVTINRINSGIDLLDSGYSCVRYRHRKDPGHPHFSEKFNGQWLTYYDNLFETTSPHLLDSIHWLEPDIEFTDKIQKAGEYFVCSSRYGNWTNNPCMYKKQFYLDTVRPFTGGGIDLEGKISKWWCEQSYRVAHGEGLFKHIDEQKYGK